MTQEENCRFVFQWGTNLACPPVPAVQTVCSVIDPDSGYVYDLTPLIKVNSNWLALDDNETYYYTYKINICEPLVATTFIGGACVGASACQSLRNPMGSNNFQSLGIASAPQLDNGNLVVVMTGV